MHIITGVSKGLGQAICQLLLEKNEKVLGIGRSHSFNHPNFSFIKCDLNEIEEVKQLNLPVLQGAITLINNAGVLGQIKRVSEQIHSDVIEVMNVNFVSPVLLTQKVYQLVDEKDQFTLVNISSGAANRAIPSWASYCSSKAALNLFSETFLLEENELGNYPKVYAVAPGVIDTAMQEKIRSIAESDFSQSKKFHELKNEGQLYSSSEAADRLLTLLSQPFKGNVRQDLRNL